LSYERASSWRELGASKNPFNQIENDTRHMKWTGF